MIITFCGHRHIRAQDDVEVWLEMLLRVLLAQGETVFYLGGYGAFDLLANRLLNRLKSEYPAIENILILPYLGRKIDETTYTGTLYPPLENVPKRLAILRRNEWMMSQADIVLAYVWAVGGAATTLGYATQKKKVIYRFPDTKPQG